MKILQVGSALYDWGGIERYVLNLAEALIVRGNDVWVTCPPGSPMASRCKGPLETIGLKSRVSLNAVMRTTRLLRREGIEVLHVHYSPDYVAAGLAAKLANTPVRILTRHLSTRWSPSKVQRNLSLFDHIIPVSDATKRALMGFGVPEDRMTVAKMGIPDSFRTTKSLSQTRRELGLSEERFWVGSFGRLVPEKGIDVLIRAIQSLPEEYGAALFGDGEARASLEELASSHKDRVRFFGQVSDVVDAMAAVDAIAIPSTWSEAFPQSALEAMALGRPIAASDIGGLPEQIEHEKTGLLFETGNAEALAAALRRFREEPDRARTWADAAQRIQREEYTIERFAERTEAVYRKVMGTRSLSL